jgi:hypothetical protein
MEDTYYDFVKKLGDWHLASSLNSNGRTLCGRPMLGNNYARDYMQFDRKKLVKKCQKCFEIYEKETNSKRKEISL